MFTLFFFTIFTKLQEYIKNTFKEICNYKKLDKLMEKIGCATELITSI